MKVAKIEYEGRVAWATVEGETVRPVTAWVEATADPLLPDLRQGSVHEGGEALRLDQVHLLPPIAERAKLFCLGLNYHDHAEEAGMAPASDTPGFFTKFSDALVGQGQPLVRPTVSTSFDFEGEIAVVIGKGGRHISHADALDYVFGYTVMMDGSLRDYQKHSISAGKIFWQSGALGPWIVTADEIPDPTRLTLETRLNGATVQSTRADLMICNISQAIAYISTLTPLRPGDIVSTGTPGGVGAVRTPPLWMKSGDVIEVEVSAIGILKNGIVDEADAGTA